MKKSLFTASEIAEKKIPGLPGTRDGVRTKAEREGWYSEERTGVGGTHKVYEIPVRYLGSEGSSTPGHAAMPSKTPMSAPVSFAKNKETRERMLIIMEGLETFLAESKLTMQPDRKVFLVDVLYRYFELEGVFSKERLAEIIKKLA